MKKTWVALSATTALAGALLVAPASAAASCFSQQHPRRAEVNRREAQQQDRIARGIRNGTLTPEETEQLESQEGALKRQERGEVRANGGSLTGPESRQLNREEDHLSHEIQRDTHN